VYYPHDGIGAGALYTSSDGHYWNLAESKQSVCLKAVSFIKCTHCITDLSHYAFSKGKPIYPM